MNPYTKVFPSQLLSIIKGSHYIPKKLKDKEKLKYHHKYYLDTYGLCKVIDVFKIDNIEYYSLLCNGRNHICISYPLNNEIAENYELLIDYSKIDKESIINSKKYYTGAEIRYWFIVNHIKINKDDIYGEYMKYLSRSSKYSLIDNEKYTVAYKPANKRLKCRIYKEKKE